MTLKNRNIRPYIRVVLNADGVRADMKCGDREHAQPLPAVSHLQTSYIVGAVYTYGEARLKNVSTTCRGQL